MRLCYYEQAAISSSAKLFLPALSCSQPNIHGSKMSSSQTFTPCTEIVNCLLPCIRVCAPLTDTSIALVASQPLSFLHPVLGKGPGHTRVTLVPALYTVDSGVQINNSRISLAPPRCSLGPCFGQHHVKCPGKLQFLHFHADLAHTAWLVATLR